jgi:DnaK suppressor protein
MNGLTRQKLRPLLQELDRRESELRELIAGERELVDADSFVHFQDPASDDADRASARTRTALETHMIDRYVRELAQLTAARERVNGGTFGVCDDCGAPIDRARLEALPATTRCIDCQNLRERRGDG